MSTKQLIENVRPREPSIQDEVATLGEDDLFDMANLTFNETGISGIVYISTAAGAHGPRVKYFQKTGKGQPSFSVSISDSPHVLAGSLPARVESQMAPLVIEWVRANRAELLSFWNDGANWTVDQVQAFYNRLQKLPAH
ncbi:MAG: hypothetical protein JSR55_07755 [Proteobacteria bacterium]|nr:hypothetical protein [Pseudomonadota bacterium]